MEASTAHGSRSRTERKTVLQTTRGNKENRRPFPRTLWPEIRSRLGRPGLEPVWTLRGALRRGILAVAKAALAALRAPQRAVRNEATPAADKKPAAPRLVGA